MKEELFDCFCDKFKVTLKFYRTSSGVPKGVYSGICPCCLEEDCEFNYHKEDNLPSHWMSETLFLQMFKVR